MIESYKGIASYIKSEYGLTYDSSTVRGWKYRDAMPVESARGRAFIPEKVLRPWFEKTILRRN